MNWLIKLFGGMTRQEFDDNINSMKRSVAAALAILGGITVADLRKKVTERLEAITAVQRSQESVVQLLEVQLKLAKADLKHVIDVREEVERVLSDLPEDVEVTLDELVFKAGTSDANVPTDITTLAVSPIQADLMSGRDDIVAGEIEE